MAGGSEPKLFVGHVPKTYAEADLAAMFGRFGELVEVSVLRERGGGASKGCAFVRFTTHAACELAIDELDGTAAGDDKLTVRYADAGRARAAARGVALRDAGGGMFAPPGGMLARGMGPFGAPPGVPGYGGPPAPMAFGGLYGVGPPPGAPGFGYGFAPAPGVYGAFGYGPGAPGAPAPLPQFGVYGQAPMMDAAAAAAIDSSRTGPDGCNLFVGQLPLTLDSMSLYQMFVPFGAVLSAKIGTDRATGASKGFGFVSFDSPAAAASAVSALNGMQMGGRRLSVEIRRSRGVAPY